MGRLAETRSAAGRGAGRGGEKWFADLGHFEIGDAIDTGLVHEYRGALVAGDLAVVLKALHRPTNVLQAVKVIHPSLIEDEAMQHLFEEEAERLQGVDADYAARLADYGRFLVERPDHQVRTFWYLATDWIDGRSVRDLLRGVPGAKAPTFSLSDASALAGSCPSGLSLEDAFSILNQAAEAVAELHRAGCSHLAIRPENLLMTRQGRVRLIGMGVPADLRRAADEKLGTMWQGSRYAPPEVARGGESEIGPASDVYSLAVLAFELFMGVPCSPFLAYEEICEAVPFVPPALDRLIISCLGAAGSRPPDADAFGLVLQEAAAAFEANQQRRRRSPARKAREVWLGIQQGAKQQPPLWSMVAGGCRRLVEEKPHLLPFGKIPRQRVEEMLAEATAGLEASRRSHLEELAAIGAWGIAEEFIERLGGDVAREEQDKLRVALARAAVTSLPRASAQRRTAVRLLQDLIAHARLPAVVRDEANAVLNNAVVDVPPQTASSIPVVTEPGVIPPVGRFRVESIGEAMMWRVVVGPALRLGRGSFDEFGNHVDLRPTRRE
ncbi:MAG: protein kinase, partial [Acidobacteria bacterium]|nr:protein kinase [Acidobacteriota bacterium]